MSSAAIGSRHRHVTGRGAASLTVLLLLLMASLLVCAWAQRNVVTEWHSARAQVQATLALEAAEAGLAWAQARLNSSEANGTGCEDAAGAAGLNAGVDDTGGTRFATRFLGQADQRGWFTPVTRTVAGVPGPLQAACSLQAQGWTCTCPGDAETGPGTSDLTALAPSFRVQFTALPQAGLVQVEATGCNHWAPPCSSAGGARADAVSRLRLSLALLPSLGTPPAATLVARGDLSVQGAAGLANADALTGGLAAQLGGQVISGALRLHTAPGAARSQALVADDSALASLTPTQLFGRHLGMSVSEWMQQPGVQRVDCSGDCAAALQRAITPQRDLARIGMQGSVNLAGPLEIGSPARPVLLVVDGPLRLSGPVQIHGVVLAERLQWDDVAQDGGGLLHGAVVLAEGFSGTGAPDLVYDPALMRRLKQQHGTWLRVPGSWKDF